MIDEHYIFRLCENQKNPRKIARYRTPQRLERKLYDLIQVS